MKSGSKVGIVCCSNGFLQSYEPKITMLIKEIEQIGFCPVLSNYIYEKNPFFNGTGQERAEALMNFYMDDNIEVIFDISGGDIANEVLPFLDYKVIAESDKEFWGYSDLTTIINAIYTKTNKPSVLYQIRNLLKATSINQIQAFKNIVIEGTSDLFDFNYNFVQGKSIEGIVVGGNIRCLLKLAGTEYWPDMTDKVLLLESFGGTAQQITSYLSQLYQLRAFDKISGIIIGTFTKLEEDKDNPSIIELIRNYIRDDLALVKTQEIGHATNSRAIAIGRKIELMK